MEKIRRQPDIIPLHEYCPTVILADGEFPTHNIPVACLNDAERIICCDGAAQKILNHNKIPDFIVGDCDSISEDIRKRFREIIIQSHDQQTNDLTKAVNFCIENNWLNITILGATGKREDHSIGNISLLADYAEKCNVRLITDYGIFNPQTENKTVYQSRTGEQISIFSLSQETEITSYNLRYPLSKMKLSSWWQGSLNEASGNTFTIEKDGGKLLVFRQHT
ncbi:MAG: thiamine diphosphokinase [Dysgonamonadaceae bacterium]|jgi:thiamine pyrophosphokinase|nr:thiamine diphosphokinase [Dysgonamonadaceae bacterium]